MNRWHDAIEQAGLAVQLAPHDEHSGILRYVGCMIADAS
jgi:hypothetical protein